MDSNMINSSNFIPKLKKNGINVTISSEGKITSMYPADCIPPNVEYTIVNGGISHVRIPDLNVELLQEGKDVKVTFINPSIG